MLASKLSATACMRPPPVEDMPNFSLFLAAAWAAELLKRRTSSYEHATPYVCSSSILDFDQRTTPRAICSCVGWLLTARVTMFPVIASGRLY